jgi:hypothetical protein
MVRREECSLLSISGAGYAFGMIPWRLFATVAVACGILAAATGRAAEPGSASFTRVHEIKALGKGAVALDGAWQFHQGDDMAWAAPGFDDSQWATIKADQNWGSQGYFGYTGFAWYRYGLSIKGPQNDPKELALLIPAVTDAYEVYWNGLLMGRNGKLPPKPDWYISQPPQTYGLGHIEDGVLAVRVWKAPLASNDPGEVGGFEDTPTLGGPQAIAALTAQLDYKWLRSQQFRFGLDSLYALLAFLSLLGWLRDRKQWLLLCMFGYTLTQPLGTFLGGLRIQFPFSITVGLLQPVLMIQDISLWYLLLLLLKLDDNKRLVRVMRVWTTVFACAFLLDGLTTAMWGSRWSAQLQVIDAILTVIFTPLETMPIVLAVAAIWQRKRLDSARWLVAICAIVSEMIFAVRNAASQFVRFTHWTLADTLRAPLFKVNGNSFNPSVISSTLLLLAIVYAVYRFSIDYRKQQGALEQEFRNAMEIQQVLIPETLPKVPGFTLTSAYKPAQQVGGDFFQIIPVEGGFTLVVLGDVSGKGLKAAMAVSLIVGAVRALAEDYAEPAQLLTQLNRRLFGRLQGGFATCLILLLKPDSTCVVASAGHPAPFLNSDEIDIPGALPLGVSQNTTYMECEVATRPGDHLALYTDGLLEARNRAGELYGFKRLEDLFSSPTNAATATEAAVNFGQDDDITVLTLTRLAAGEESRVVHLTPSLLS